MEKLECSVQSTHKRNEILFLQNRELKFSSFSSIEIISFEGCPLRYCFF